MTVPTAPVNSSVNRAEQLEQLRKQMAAVSSKGGAKRHAELDFRAVALPAESLLPIPDSLVELLPAGLPRGVVAVLTGARSLSLSMAAAVTAAGGHVAIVGRPDAGLLAAAEMGADLDRLAVIPDPGADPLEVAAVLMDGMDLVVLGLGGRTVAPARARAVTARAQHRGCTLVVTTATGRARRSGSTPGCAVTRWPVAGCPGSGGSAGSGCRCAPAAKRCPGSAERWVGYWRSGAWTGRRWRPRRQWSCLPRHRWR